MADVAILRAYTSCRYGQLHYREARPAGKPSAPPLVLLHQNPSSSLEYETLIREMGRDRRVVAFDTPGNGMSDPPPAPPSMAEYAAAFADGIEALRLGQGEDGGIDVFGFHTGTYLASELALLRPRLVRRVILSGIPARSAEQRAVLLREADATPPPTEDGEKIFEFLRWLWSHVVTERDPGVPIERAAEVFGERAMRPTRRTWQYHGVWSYPFADRLPLIRQPTMVYQAREPLFEISRAASRLIPNCRFVDAAPLTRDLFEVGVEHLSRTLREFLG